jgi:hypothetical protein
VALSNGVKPYFNFLILFISSTILFRVSSGTSYQVADICIGFIGLFSDLCKTAHRKSMNFFLVIRLWEKYCPP